MKKMIFVLIATVGFSSAAFAWGGNQAIKGAKAANLYIAMNAVAHNPAATACANSVCTIQIANPWCTRTWDPSTQSASYDCTMTVMNKDTHVTDKSADQFYNAFLKAGGGVQCKFQKCAFLNPLISCQKHGEGKDLNSDFNCTVNY